MRLAPRHITPHILLLTVLLLSACADNRRTVALLDRAETLMDSLPDSAYTLLKACDSTIPEQSEKTGHLYNHV